MSTTFYEAYKTSETTPELIWDSEAVEMYDAMMNRAESMKLSDSSWEQYFKLKAEAKRFGVKHGIIDYLGHKVDLDWLKENYDEQRKEAIAVDEEAEEVSNEVKTSGNTTTVETVPVAQLRSELEWLEMHPEYHNRESRMAIVRNEINKRGGVQ